MPSVSVKVNPTILNWLMQKAQQGNVGSSVIDLIKMDIRRKGTYFQSN